ncbi:MAG: glycoside hydrolase family 18 protein [Bacteroidetes bacterium]|nr:glycoside hydrolase family 18 protein [Bacteroidota bacterium]
MAYYYTRWNNFKPETLPFDKLTHIIFSFTEVIDGEMKFPEDTLGLMLKKLVKERKKYPKLKVMVACGGWAGSKGFSEMARTDENRKKFVESALKFIKEYDIDGIDIDWEYPGLPGDNNPYLPEDKENFTKLMCELKTGMNTICDYLVLTWASAGWEKAFEFIELDKVMQCVNYVNVMSYDLAGGGDSYTSHHTNLGLIKMEDIQTTPAAAKMIEEGDSTKPFSTEKIVNLLLDKGVNPAQIVIGSNFSGRAWQGVPPENNGLYQLNRGRARLRASYSVIRESMEDKNGFVRYWDPIAKAPYLYNAKDSLFITYDDTVSVRLKTKYVVDLGLGGIMFWQLSADAPKDGLVDAIYKEKMKNKKE